MFIVNQTPYVKKYRTIHIGRAKFTIYDNLLLIRVNLLCLIYKNNYLIGGCLLGNAIHSGCFIVSANNSFGYRRIDWSKTLLCGWGTGGSHGIPFYIVKDHTVSIYGYKVYDYKSHAITTTRFTRTELYDIA